MFSGISAADLMWGALAGLFSLATYVVVRGPR